MKLDRIRFMCPYLDGSPEGVVCHAASDLIRNIKDISLTVCMGRHFETCHVYVTKLRMLSEVGLMSSCVEKGNDY